MTTQFDNIYHDLALQLGSKCISAADLICPLIEHVRSLELRMAASGMAWMNNETKDVVSIPSADIKWASWFRVARNFRLRVGLKDKSRRENFDGFMRDVSNTSSIPESLNPCLLFTGSREACIVAETTLRSYT